MKARGNLSSEGAAHEDSLIIGGAVVAVMWMVFVIAVIWLFFWGGKNLALAVSVGRFSVMPSFEKNLEERDITKVIADLKGLAK